MIARRFIDALRFRLFWLKYGSFFLRRSQFRVRQLRINGSAVKLSVPAGEEAVMDYEIQNILYSDCYGLADIEGNVNNILDIGGNLGFFSLAARSHFPNAKIHTYEPNPKVQAHLANNVRGLAIEVHPEAVGASDGWIEMNNDSGSLFAKTVNSGHGNIKKTAFATVLNRVGGPVDLLKLDCEGAEWELFECKDLWKNIRCLTLEYHLWARPDLDALGTVKIIKDLGFRITRLHESPELKWGILQATKAS